MTVRALVTGATGFVGRQALAPLRALGFEVHAVTSRTPPRDDGGVVRWHRADLLDPGAAAELLAAARPTHVLHLAWYAEHGRFWASPENLRWLEASLRLLRAARESGVERMVLAGTCAEYDWSVGGRCVEDVTPLAPGTLYGTTKDALRAVGQKWAAGGGPQLAWGRIFFLYGPHEHPDRLVSSVTRSLLAGRPAKTSHGRQLRDFLHVADAGAAFAALLAADATGAVNVASGRAVAIADVVREIGEATGRPELVELGALSAREGEPDELVAGVTRLRDDVGFVPRLGLREGIADAVGWWRAVDRAR